MEAQRQIKRGYGGRPRTRKVATGERVTISVRITPEMRRRLEKATAVSGRSLSQEAEMRMERSFWLDDLLKARLISARVPAGSAKGE